MSDVKNPSEYEYRRLRGRIVERYRTQCEFAKRIGITKNALSRKMTGKAMLSQKDIELWCELLDIERSEIGEYFFT